MSLTPKQREQLDRLVTLKLSPAWEKLKFPGFPDGCCDMRVIPALQKRGLVECIIHEYFLPVGNAPISHEDRRLVVTYRATPEGRALCNARADSSTITEKS
jgi:hypothetical protein